MHTNQVITDRARNTTVVNEDISCQMRSQKPSSTAKIKLEDVDAAQRFQQGQIGKSLGIYNERTNSCVDHVADVLRAGGADVPEGAGGQMKYMIRNGIKIKD